MQKYIITFISVLVITIFENMDKISVIVPAYNAQTTIKRCLDSLANQQTADLFEYDVVVVDDGSSDLTPPIRFIFRQL